ncbi:MAG: hypothetical protein BWY31_04172 [Lentisphaerae bacterium ADurb.Bin242]|nr:MAG: hypothetical protein BWY31_04172 [Lentisphaerae bacterium ADurb.Bin242]
MAVSKNYGTTVKYFLPSEFDPVLAFAVSELKKYLGKIAGIELERTFDESDADYLVGIPEMAYSKWDDGIMIRSRGGKLILTGTNSRSVLFAVYDYLGELGCRWTSPGLDTLPSGVSADLDHLDKIEYASSRYRGYAVCGAGDDEAGMPCMRDMIDWMLKQKCNLYFSEGFPLECPGDEWAVMNGIRPLQHIEYTCANWSVEERNSLIARREELIEFTRSRGMLIERYGHGWAAGIVEHFAALRGITLDEAKKRLKAKGRISREAGGVGMSTMWFQFCMSEPGLKELYVEHVVEYLKKHHTEADIAAFWLGDGYDNACLCPRCIEKPFSEWYMEIFDEIVRKVSEFAPELRFEGLIYFMTTEPPRSRWLEGIDSVDFIIAPWNRCYRHRLDASECRYPDWKPDFRHNASHDFENHRRPLNNDVGESIRGWKDKIGHFHTRMFEYYSLSTEPGRHRLSYDASGLARDIRDFNRLGIEGSVSCENMFTDLPFFLIHQVSAALMWNPETDEKQIRKTLASDLYGKNARRVLHAADKIGRILLEFNEHGNTEKSVCRKMIAELEETASEIEDLTVPVLDLWTLVWMLSIDTEKECSVLKKLLAILSRENTGFSRFCRSDMLRKQYESRLREISKTE